MLKSNGISCDGGLVCGRGENRDHCGQWGRRRCVLFGTKGPSKWMTFRNAIGGAIDHYGAGDVMVVSPFLRRAEIGIKSL